MIKLKQPLNHNGLLYDEGSILQLPPDTEVRMVQAESAEYINPEEIVQQEEDEEGPEERVGRKGRK